MKPGGETESALDEAVKSKQKENIPILNAGQDRESNLLSNSSAVFEIERDPKSLKWDLWDQVRTFDGYGKRAVEKYNALIEKNAKKHNLDPDIIRAVMYAENARGHKLFMNKLADITHVSEAILPMNIQNRKWAKIIDREPEDLYNPDINIEASTVLLKRIKDRIRNPTPEKIGSIWNFSGKEKTSEFGEYIGALYIEKPWRKK